MNSGLDLPLISCICITSGRTNYLYRCIIGFAQQNYLRKELVISYPTFDKDSATLIDYIKCKTDLQIIQIARDINEAIGAARNEAAQNATGEYLCMWDDDDLYTTERLTEQYTGLINNGKTFAASVYNQILLYHSFEKRAYLSFPSYWGCTLLCRRDIFLNFQCETQDQFEYTKLIKSLTDKNEIFGCNFPTSYVFHYHGKNRLNYKTFLFLINNSTKIALQFSEMIEKHLSLY